MRTSNFRKTNMSWLITNLIAAFLLPPLNLLLVAITGLLFLRKRPRLGRALVALSLALLWLCSTPFAAHSALRLLEDRYSVVDPQTQPADAIVVLGGGNYPRAPEYGNRDTPGYATLERLRYAAKLYRETGKPILASGGMLPENDSPEAQQMKAVLEQEFNVPVRWTENESLNTLEDARYSYPILQQAGIRRIYLVTHASHMPRAAMAFRSAGFEVVPAPMAFTSHFGIGLFSFIPMSGSLDAFRSAMHEFIGLLWYRLKS